LLCLNRPSIGQERAPACIRSRQFWTAQRRRDAPVGELAASRRLRAWPPPGPPLSRREPAVALEAGILSSSGLGGDGRRGGRCGVGLQRDYPAAPSTRVLRRDGVGTNLGRGQWVSPASARHACAAQAFTPRRGCPWIHQADVDPSGPLPHGLVSDTWAMLPSCGVRSGATMGRTRRQCWGPLS
jgi:hypothetical protein